MINVYATEKNPLDLELTAFPIPDATTTSIAFHSLSSIPEYVPVLVQITSWVGNTITYVAVNAGKLSPALKSHELDLTRLDDVWPRLPSTLAEWDAVDRPCVLLFLSESYLKGGRTLADGTTERQDVIDARPVVTAGCPKWPCAKGDFRDVVTENERLKVEKAKLLDDNAALQIRYEEVNRAYTELKGNNTSVIDMYTSLKRQAALLQPTLSPTQRAHFDLTPFL